MVASLPPAAQLKVRQALAQWRHWHCEPQLAAEPALQRTLDGGLSNTSVLVSSGDREYVLRLDGHSPQRLGLSRAAEWRAHQNAAASHLAPEPVYFNPELGVLVSAYRRQDPELLRGAEELDAIATLLRGIHALPAVKFRLQPLDRATHYLGLLGESTPPENFIQACSRLSEATQSCLCHNDLLRENRLQHKGRLMAIDWEYTAVGDPWFDLAAICEGDGLDAAACRQLSEAYLRAPPTPAQEQRLRDNRLAYGYLTELWRRITRQRENTA